MNNINDNERSSMTQSKMIRAWLEKGKTITSLEALEMFGCFRLASRISELRLRDGMNIARKKVKTPSGKWVAEYSLVCENA